MPEGYCGICDVCGEPGYKRAHPHNATTGSWCDEHWADVVFWRSFGLHKLLWYVLVALSTGAFVVYWVTCYWESASFSVSIIFLDSLSSSTFCPSRSRT